MILDVICVDSNKYKDKPNPLLPFKIENVMADNQWMDPDENFVYEEKSSNESVRICFLVHKRTTAMDQKLLI